MGRQGKASSGAPEGLAEGNIPRRKGACAGSGVKAGDRDVYGGGGAGWAESTRGPLPPVAAAEVILGGEACGRGGAGVGGDVAPGKRRGSVRVVIAGGWQPRA